MSPNLPGAVPELPVRQIAAAVAYYRDRLGFALDWGGEELGLAGISRDGCRIFLASERHRRARGNVGPSVVWLNLASREDVDALHRDWTSGGAMLDSAPRSEAWGLHEFTATDPDGNRLRVFYDFATPERVDDPNRDV